MSAQILTDFLGRALAGGNPRVRPGETGASPSGAVIAGPLLGGTMELPAAHTLSALVEFGRPTAAAADLNIPGWSAHVKASNQASWSGINNPAPWIPDEVHAFDTWEDFDKPADADQELKRAFSLRTGWTDTYGNRFGFFPPEQQPPIGTPEECALNIMPGWVHYELAGNPPADAPDRSPNNASVTVRLFLDAVPTWGPWTWNAGTIDYAGDYPPLWSGMGYRALPLATMRMVHDPAAGFRWLAPQFLIPPDSGA